MENNNLPPWFPKYINLKNINGDDIWVLRELIDNHTACYWKVSGEWGKQIRYNGYTYSVSCYSPVSSNPNGELYKEYLLPASPEQFLKNNTQCLLSWSKQACIDAWDEIRKINNLAKTQTWEQTPGGYSHHIETYFTNKYYNWNI